MRDSRERCYWDSCAFLGWLNAEEDKLDECQLVLDAAEGGDVLIVASTITLAEVVRIKNRARLRKADEDRIREFFENEYIELRAVDRRVAEYARQLMWEFPALRHKDAIHAATAQLGDVSVLHTFDDDLLKLSGHVGNPPLTIVRPTLSSDLKEKYCPSQVGLFGKTDGNSDEE